MKFALPFDLAGVEIYGIEEVMHGDFVREFEVARVQTIQKFLAFESLLREFGDVVVGIVAADLRLFRFAIGGDGREEDVLAPRRSAKTSQGPESRLTIRYWTLSTMSGEASG